ncbi:AraC family transcriptional regulator [Methylocapsa sp. S129]|uniref:AraC family transcriptional regulator n=1 Tax=Methylocapsa sp. S129 TaxID=1641869 RepID=UPI00131A6AD6|nr:AraC family transcriptional regulator [Methylocapsa sp. S129]
MTLTGKALRMIERHLDRDLTLGEIARSCGVSSYHLAHAFGESAGVSVMQYVRARRLTAAAQALAMGAPDILHLALDAGYGSHEAFTRAFRAQFGCTPEMVRRKAKTEDLAMIEAMKIPDDGRAELEAPRIVAGKPMLVVGLAERHAFSDPKDIPGQWQKFMALYGEIPDKANPIPIGVSANMDEDGNFEYFCAVEVARFSSAPRGLKQLRIPAQTYALFHHRDHVAKIGATYAAIWNRWLPDNNRAVADGPSIERHLETFDPRTGLGGVEIWIPIKDAA